MKSNFLNFLFAMVLFSGPLLAQNGVVDINKSAALERLIELKKEVNKSANLIRIQIYSGPRSGAEKTLAYFRSLFLNHPSEMKYETPNYKIWVGKFRTKIEADRALIKIKKEYPNAFLFTPKQS